MLGQNRYSTPTSERYRSLFEFTVCTGSSPSLAHSRAGQGRVYGTSDRKQEALKIGQGGTHTSPGHTHRFPPGFTPNITPSYKPFWSQGPISSEKPHLYAHEALGGQLDRNYNIARRILKRKFKLIFRFFYYLSNPITSNLANNNNYCLLRTSHLPGMSGLHLFAAVLRG